MYELATKHQQLKVYLTQHTCGHHILWVQYTTNHILRCQELVLVPLVIYLSIHLHLVRKIQFLERILGKICLVYLSTCLVLGRRDIITFATKFWSAIARSAIDALHEIMFLQFSGNLFGNLWTMYKSLSAFGGGEVTFNMNSSFNSYYAFNVNCTYLSYIFIITISLLYLSYFIRHVFRYTPRSIL